MSDRDVQREIEENERRVRDEQDVGLDEDVVERQDDGGFLDDLGGGLLGNDDDSGDRNDQRREGDSGD